MRGCRCAVGTDPTGRDRLAGQARHGQNSATTASLRRDAEQAVCAGPPQRPGQALWRKERPVHTGRPGADEMQTRRRPGTGSSGTGQECTAGAQVRTQAARRQAAVTPDQTFFCGACAGGRPCANNARQARCRRDADEAQALCRQLRCRSEWTGRVAANPPEPNPPEPRPVRAGSDRTCPA